jgi:hypothetical protein
MIWRCLIRTLCLALLALCLAAWVGSSWCYPKVVYAGKVWPEKQNSYNEVSLLAGRIHFLRRGDTRTGMPPEWHAFFDGFRPSDRPVWKNWDSFSNFHFLGFSYFHDVTVYVVTIPLYFPPLLTTLLLFLLWRKTRRKYNARGFPVEAIRTREAVGKEAKNP